MSRSQGWPCVSLALCTPMSGASSSLHTAFCKVCTRCSLGNARLRLHDVRPHRLGLIAWPHRLSLIALLTSPSSVPLNLSRLKPPHLRYPDRRRLTLCCQNNSARDVSPVEHALGTTHRRRVSWTIEERPCQFRMFLTVTFILDSPFPRPFSLLSA
jgi:hypothetical protein